jgi:hypothetical protein
MHHIYNSPDEVTAAMLAPGDHYRVTYDPALPFTIAHAPRAESGWYDVKGTKQINGAQVEDGRVLYIHSDRQRAAIARSDG